MYNLDQKTPDWTHEQLHTTVVDVRDVQSLQNSIAAILEGAFARRLWVDLDLPLPVCIVAENIVHTFMHTDEGCCCPFKLSSCDTSCDDSFML